MSDLSAIPRTPRPTSSGESEELNDTDLHRQISGTELPVNAGRIQVGVEGVCSPPHLSSQQSRHCDAPTREVTPVVLCVPTPPPPPPPATPTSAVLSPVAFGVTIRVVSAEGVAARPGRRSPPPRTSISSRPATHLLSVPAPCILLRRDSFWTMNHEGVMQAPDCAATVENYVVAARLADCDHRPPPALFEPPPSPRS